MILDENEFVSPLILLPNRNLRLTTGLYLYNEIGRRWHVDLAAASVSRVLKKRGPPTIIYRHS